MTTLKAQIAKAILDYRYPGEEEASNYRDVPPKVVQEIDALAEAVAGKLPDHAGTDFVRMMETWTEDGVNLTATLLDMAICVMLLKRHQVNNPGEEFPASGLTTTITSAELRTIAEHYHWERREEAGSWTIKLEKISEMGSRDA